MAETGESVAMRSNRQAQRSESIQGVEISADEDQLERLRLRSVQIELDQTDKMIFIALNYT